MRSMLRQWQKKRSKGHFVVYTKEGKRFVVPLCYLNHPIFRVLLEMAEEEFGPLAHGPLRVPCEEGLMDYIVHLLKRSQRRLVSGNACNGGSLSALFPLCHAYSLRQQAGMVA